MTSKTKKTKTLMRVYEMSQNSDIVLKFSVIGLSPKSVKPKNSARGTKDKAVNDWRIPEITEKTIRIND